MGCDIHAHAERKSGDDWQRLSIDPFDWRNYGLFAFLAGVRNYSGIEPIAAPRGLPPVVSSEVCADYRRWDGDAHTASYLGLDELSAFDYDADMEDRRYTKQLAPNHFDGGATCEPGQGERKTWRAFLGTNYFDDLKRLQELGADRVVFWFDN